jgi:[ribosomal protein S5]-alanine N-acetyltransferase
MSFKDGFKEFPVIQTKRLYLDRLTPNDYDTAYRYMRDFRKNSSWAISYIAATPGSFKTKKSIWWAIRDNKSKPLIGVCKLFNFEYQFKSEIGYFIGRPYWGKGYAGEAIQALVDFGFNVLGLHRIYASTCATNIQSQRVLIKSNFIKEAELIGTTVREGSFCNEIVYGIINRKDNIENWVGKEWAT